MTSRSSQSPNLDFDIGAKVQCRDGSCGKLIRVVIDPDTDSVVALVVESGLLQKDARIVPLRLVEAASPDTIQLDIDSERLEDFVEYTETEYAALPPDWQHDRYNIGDASYAAPPYIPIIDAPVMPMVRQTVHEGIPSTQEVVGQGTPVRDLSGEVGVVDRVFTNRESGLITHLVVKLSGLLSSDTRIVPIDFVSEIDDLGVLIHMKNRDFDDLPEYRPERSRPRREES